MIVGQEAMFQCGQSNVLATGWTVNGTRINDVPSFQGAYESFSSGPVEHLTITAGSLHNSSVIQCIGFFANGSSTAPPSVVLRIQGIIDC